MNRYRKAGAKITAGTRPSFFGSVVLKGGDLFVVWLGLDRSATRNVAILNLIQKKRNGKTTRELETSSYRLAFANNLSQQTVNTKSTVRILPLRQKGNRTSSWSG
jgi:hypothetical protein